MTTQIKKKKENYTWEHQKYIYENFNLNGTNPTRIFAKAKIIENFYIFNFFENEIDYRKNLKEKINENFNMEEEL